MKFQTTEVIDTCMILGSSAWALSDVREVLSIVILCLNGLWILMKFIIKFIHYYSNDKKIDDKEYQDLLNDIDKASDKINKDGDK